MANQLTTLDETVGPLLPLDPHALEHEVLRQERAFDRFERSEGRFPQYDRTRYLFFASLPAYEASVIPLHYKDPRYSHGALLIGIISSDESSVMQRNYPSQKEITSGSFIVGSDVNGGLVLQARFFVGNAGSHRKYQLGGKEFHGVKALVDELGRRLGAEVDLHSNHGFRWDYTPTSLDSQSTAGSVHKDTSFRKNDFKAIIDAMHTSLRAYLSFAGEVQSSHCFVSWQYGGFP